MRFAGSSSKRHWMKWTARDKTSLKLKDVDHDSDYLCQKHETLKESPNQPCALKCVFEDPFLCRPL